MLAPSRASPAPHPGWPRPPCMMQASAPSRFSTGCQQIHGLGSVDAMRFRCGGSGRAMRCDAIAQPTHMRWPTHMRCDAISAHAIGITQAMRCDVDARRHRCRAHKQQEQGDAMSMRCLEAGPGPVVSMPVANVPVAVKQTRDFLRCDAIRCHNVRRCLSICCRGDALRPR